VCRPFTVAIVLALVLLAVIAPNIARGELVHLNFEVGPGGLAKRTFHINYGNLVTIILYVYSGGYSSDIIFRIIDPDGREIYPREKVYGRLIWSFKANQSGYYIFEFDNTYSPFAMRKNVDLAISIEPLPTTVTVPVYTITRETVTVPTYITEYRTVTMASPAVLLCLTPESWLPLIIVLAVGLLIGLPIGYVLKRPQKT